MRTPEPAGRIHLAAVAGLVLATVVWGSTFLVTKNSLDSMDVANFLMWRFGIAAVILLAASPSRWLTLSAQDLRRGLIIGFFLGTGFLAQTQGLRDTSAAVSGFLTGMLVVLAPLVAAVVFREHVTARGWVAVLVATVGLALISLKGWSLSPGAFITLVGAALFAVQVAGLGQWATAANSYGITAVSVTVAAVLAGVVGAFLGELAVPDQGDQWVALIYLAVGATCFGLVLQAWSQAHLPITTAAVIMTLEPVFAGLIAVLIGGESLTARVWLGGLLIVAAMFISELGPRRSREVRSPKVD